MRIVSLFAGAGGEVLGAHRAGFEHVEAVEWDHDAATTLELATGGGMFGRAHPAWSGPPLVVRRCSVADWTPVAADVWWASPPCQPDSVAGKRLGADDERDGWPMVWAAFDRAAVRPIWVVFETVPGILSTTRAARWADIVGAARARFTSVEWRVVDAVNFGVPQHRKRVVMVCGPRQIEWPHEWPNHVTTRDALELNGGERVIGGGHNPSHAGDVRRYLDLTDRPSTTIAASVVGNAGPFVESPDGARRRLTTAERAALQCFPADWPFQGPGVSQDAQVGNAVPPPMAEAVLGGLLNG